jgi:hypothetical protein
MVQIENSIRVRINNLNDDKRSFNIAADCEINKENDTIRIFSGDVRKDEQYFASFSQHGKQLSVVYNDLSKQIEVNASINDFIAEAVEKVKDINF